MIHLQHRQYSQAKEKSRKANFPRGGPGMVKMCNVLNIKLRNILKIEVEKGLKSILTPHYRKINPRPDGAKRRARVLIPPRLFTPGETKALGKSKVDQISRAWVTVGGWSSSLISKIWRTVMNSGH